MDKRVNKYTYPSYDDHRRQEEQYDFWVDRDEDIRRTAEEIEEAERLYDEREN